MMAHGKPRWVATLLALMMVTAIAPAGSGFAQSGSRTFTETGKTVSGKFLAYWDSHGGLAQQGFPISDELQEKSDTDGKTYTVQYFERAVFESHPENQAPNDVLLQLLGVFLYKQKYGAAGAPGQTASTNNPRLFSETGKTMGGKFRAYWESHGGLAQQGFPISNEFQETSELNGKTYTVQYFERAVFELHPENQPPFDVLLSQLGTFRWRAKQAPPTATPTVQASNPTPTARVSNEVNINIVDFQFSPRIVTVPVGTTVTWTEVGPTEHNTVSKTRLWESPILEVGQKFSFTFTTPGTYDYLCTLHPDMTAQIVVR